jgi:hypothetical protein
MKCSPLASVCEGGLHQCGVAWLIGERRVTGVTADAIVIETEFSGRLRFYRNAP